jgi:hypothetical protein
MVSWTLTTIACLPVYLALIIEFVNDGFRWTEYPGDLFTFGCFGFGYVVWIPINLGSSIELALTDRRWRWVLVPSWLVFGAALAATVFGDAPTSPW